MYEDATPIQADAYSDLEDYESSMTILRKDSKPFSFSVLNQPSFISTINTNKKKGSKTVSKQDMAEKKIPPLTVNKKPKLMTPLKNQIS